MRKPTLAGRRYSFQIMTGKISLIAHFVAALWAINVEFITHGLELGIGGVGEIRVEP